MEKCFSCYIFNSPTCLLGKDFNIFPLNCGIFLWKVKGYQRFRGETFGEFLPR